MKKVTFISLLGFITLMSSLFFPSCGVHFFVNDSKFVKTQSGYLLFYEKKISDKDTGIIEDVYLEKLGDSNAVRTVFSKSEIDTSLSNAEIIEKIKESNTAIEFGEFCERSGLLKSLADTLVDKQYGTFYFIPASVSYINIHSRKSFRKVNLKLNGKILILNILESSFQLINVEPFFNKWQYDRIKQKNTIKKDVPPPY